MSPRPRRLIHESHCGVPVSAYRAHHSAVASRGPSTTSRCTSNNTRPGYEHLLKAVLPRGMSSITQLNSAGALVSASQIPHLSLGGGSSDGSKDRMSTGLLWICSDIIPSKWPNASRGREARPTGAVCIGATPAKLGEARDLSQPMTSGEKRRCS